MASYGVTCSESPAQMILALCALGLSPEDERFVKDGGSLVDAVLRYRQKDGSFLHSQDTGGSDLVATEQCLAALTAVQRHNAGQATLYRITDPVKLGDLGLAGRDPAVKSVPPVTFSPAFSDIAGLSCSGAVLGLAARNILNGMGDGTFQPNANMTRAQFAKLAVTALGIPAAGTANFPDVAKSKWYSAPVAAAARYGIVNGRDDGKFDPEGNIDLQEAAAMVCRAAALCGLDTALSSAETEKVLGTYSDTARVQSWARPTLAWCLKNAVVTRSGSLEPRAVVVRGEIAMMFWRLLELAKLR